MNTKRHIKILDAVSYGLLATAMIAVMLLLAVNIGRAGTKGSESQSGDLREILFFPEMVYSIVIVDETYAFVYYGDMELHTTTAEAESLIEELEYIWSNYADESVALEEAMGSITDNSWITEEGSVYVLELDWIKKDCPSGSCVR